MIHQSCISCLSSLVLAWAQKVSQICEINYLEEEIPSTNQSFLCVRIIVRWNSFADSPANQNIWNGTRSIKANVIYACLKLPEVVSTRVSLLVLNQMSIWTVDITCQPNENPHTLFEAGELRSSRVSFIQHGYMHRWVRLRLQLEWTVSQDHRPWFCAHACTLRQVITWRVCVSTLCGRSSYMRVKPNSLSLSCSGAGFYWSSATVWKCRFEELDFQRSQSD